MRRQKLLIPAFFATNVEHAAAEQFVAQSFSARGAEVLVVRCNRELRPRCISMSPGNISKIDAENTCKNCRFFSGLNFSERSYQVADLGDFLSDRDLETADQLVNQLSPTNWRNFELDGVPLGSYWSFNSSVEFKTVNLGEDEQSWDHYLETARGNLLAFFAARNIAKDWKPTAAAAYSFEYSTNRSFFAGLDEATPKYTFHQPISRRRYSKLAFSRADMFVDWFEDSRFNGMWELPLDRKEIRELNRSIWESIRATSVFSYSSARRFSSSAEVKSALGVSSGKPIITILTSSPDEVDAGNLAGLRPSHRFFDDDLEICRVLGPLASQRPDLHFVVRVHPRLFPNRRDSVRSSRVDEMLSLLPDEDNIYVDLPGAQVEFGLYDLVAVSDAFVSGRSSAAWELSVLGLPVVYIDPSRDPTLPPKKADSRKRGTSTLTINEISSRLSKAITEGPSSQDSISVARFVVGFTERVFVPLGSPLTLAITQSLLGKFSQVSSLLEWLIGRLWRVVRRESKSNNLSMRLKFLRNRYPHFFSLPRENPNVEFDLVSDLEGLAVYRDVRPSRLSSEERNLIKVRKKVRRAIGIKLPRVSHKFR